MGVDEDALILEFGKISLGKGDKEEEVSGGGGDVNANVDGGEERSLSPSPSPVLATATKAVPEEEEEWKDAVDMSSADNATDWDLLLGRGKGTTFRPATTRDWSRDSLFVKFDPLVQKPLFQPPPPPPSKEEADSSRPLVDMSVAITSNGNGSLDEDKEAGTGGGDVNVVDRGEELPLSPSPLIVPEINNGNQSLDEDKEAETGGGDVNGGEELSFSPSPSPVLVTTTKAEEEEDWKDAVDMSSAENATDWDLLLGRGKGTTMNQATTRDWSRNSLFVKFDPLVQKPLFQPPPPPSPKQEHDSSSPLVDMSVAPASNGNGSLEEDKEAETGGGDVNGGDVVDRGEELPLSPSPLQVPETNNGNQSLDEGNEAEGQKKANRTTKNNMPESEKKAALLSKQKYLEQLVQLSQEEVETLKQERDCVKADLNDFESAFAELLLVYESGKVYQKNFEANAKALTARIEWYQRRIQRQKEKQAYILEQAEEKKKMIMSDYDERLKALETEKFKLNAALKMGELKVDQLQHESDRLQEESMKIQKLCDEMLQN